MKKISLKVVTCLVAGGLMFSSCIGSYSLFNKFTSWELRMTKSKFVNAIIGFVINIVCIPVTLVVDSLVLNTIEFWSGENPLQSNVGKTQQVMGQDGKLYAVKTLKNGYEITSPEGEVTLLTYNKKDNSWSMSQNGVVKELFRFNEDGKTISVNVNGENRDFTMDQQGVADAQWVACGGQFFAQR